MVCESIFGYYYFTYRHNVDERLQKPLFEQTAKIYAAPKELRVGQKLTPQAVAQELRDAGYSGDNDHERSRMGTYSLNDASITIQPGPQSYHSEQSATVTFDKGMVSQISGDGGQALDAYELEPVLITGLSEGQNRTKRRLVSFNELPPNLVNAVTSIEDRRFFEHGGVDYFRLLGALRDDLRLGRRREGGSTLTMQLARGFFLTPEKRVKRKIIEIAITFQLENRFNKQQIFQIYANEIPLGQQGSFAINGFGQAAQTYFGKDVKDLDLAQCAMLAGMIQHPSFLNPYRHPDRVILRRNMVLDAMVETGKITKEESIQAKAEPLNLRPMNVDAGEAPYFVDLVRDRLAQHMGDADFNHSGLRIYTSLDPDLQRLASDAVTEGHEGRRPAGGKAACAPGESRGRFTHQLSPGRVSGVEPAYRPGVGTGGRAELRRQPVRSCGTEPADRLRFQAFCLCRGLQHQPGGHRAHPAGSRAAGQRRGRVHDTCIGERGIRRSCAS